MNTTSTYSQDAARGHDHPVSRAARKQRIAEAREAKYTKVQQFNQALQLIRLTLRDEEQLVTLLHVASSTLAGMRIISGNMSETIESLDILADEIEAQL